MNKSNIIPTSINVCMPCFRRAQIYDTGIPSVEIDFEIEGIHNIKPEYLQFSAKYSYCTEERRMLSKLLS